MFKKFFTRNRGFSIVELAVVLVVIALLAGTALVVNGLTKTSKLNSVIMQAKQYITAINVFYQEYSYYPGDFPYASTILNTSAYNGNANGRIDWQTTPPENFFVWQHLSLANIIEGNFNGAAALTFGVNIPFTPISGATFNAEWYNSPSWLYNLNEQNLLEFGQATSPDSNLTQHSILTPSDAYFIDSKIDDGIPNHGRVLGYTGFEYSPNTSYCVTQSGSTYSYNLGASGIYCFMIFLIQSY